MSASPVTARGPRPDPVNGQVWTCDGCGRESNWTPKHAWYGNWKDAEECRWSKLVIDCGCGTAAAPEQRAAA